MTFSTDTAQIFQILLYQWDWYVTLFSQRCQLLEIKCGWSAKSALLIRSISWGLEMHSIPPSGNKGQNLFMLLLYTKRSCLGDNFLPITKCFSSINYLINLLHIPQLLTFILLSLFQLDWEAIYPALSI